MLGCRAQGFACTFRKTAIQCENELEYARRLQSEASLRDARAARRPFRESAFVPNESQPGDPG